MPVLSLQRKRTIMLIGLWLLGSVAVAQVQMSPMVPEESIPLQQFVEAEPQRADQQARNLPLPPEDQNIIQAQTMQAIQAAPVSSQGNSIFPANGPNFPPPQSASQIEASASKETGTPEVRAAVPLSELPIDQRPAGPNDFAGGIDSQSFIVCAKMATGICLRAQTDKDFAACLGRLKQQPACDQFIKFAEIISYGLRDEVDLLQYYKEGQLTLVHVRRMGDTYPGDYYLIGANGHFLNVTAGAEIRGIDITKDVRYPQIASRFPKVQIWSVVSQLPVSGTSPTGGLRLIFRFELLNGCATCDLAGYANVAYDFSDTGVLQQVSLLSLESIFSGSQ